MRVLLVALVVIAVAAAAACALEHDPGLGTPCGDDEDCPNEFFCGGDLAEEGDRARVCVPETECDPGVFDVACGGPGYYSCVDDQVRFTECDSGECRDGECVE